MIRTNLENRTSASNLTDMIMSKFLKPWQYKPGTFNSCPQVIALRGEASHVQGMGAQPLGRNELDLRKDLAMTLATMGGVKVLTFPEGGPRPSDVVV